MNRILSDSSNSHKNNLLGANQVIGGGLLGAGNSGRAKGNLFDMISPANRASNMSESPIFSTSFGNNRLGRKDGRTALNLQRTSLSSQQSEELKLLANLDKERSKRLGFEEELLVDSSGNNSSPTIIMPD